MTTVLTWALWTLIVFIIGYVLGDHYATIATERRWSDAVSRGSADRANDR